MLDGIIRKIEAAPADYRYKGALDDLRDINFYTRNFHHAPVAGYWERFVGHKRAAWIPHQAELHRKTEPIMLAPANLDFESICRGQGIMTDQTVFVGWNVEKVLSILSFEKRSPGHRFYS